MPQQPPQTRQQLFELVASLIGWGATLDDVEPIVKRLEARGVEFVPSARLPDGFVNPLAAGQG
jgi:hypothetical protein